MLKSVMAMSPHIAIRVANGGYIVQADVKGDDSEGWVTTLSIHSDLRSLLSYVARVVKGLEGEGAELDLSEL